MDIKKLARCAVILLVFSVQLIGAQVLLQKKQEWYTVYNSAVSDNGQWVFFTKTFDHGDRQGILKNTKKGTEVEIAHPGKFYLGNDYFMVLNNAKNLHFQDFRSGYQTVFNSILDYKYDPVFKKLMLQKEDELVLFDIKYQKETRFMGVTKMVDISGTPCALLYKENTVQLLNKNNGISFPLSHSNTTIVSSIADSAGKSIKLLVKTEDGYEVEHIDYFGKIDSQPHKLNFPSDFSTYSFVNENTVMASKQIVEESKTNLDSVEIWSNRDQALKPRLMTMQSHAKLLIVQDLNKQDITSKIYQNFTTDYYLIFDDAYLLEVSNLTNYNVKIIDLAPQPKIVLRNRKTDKVVMEEQQVQLVYPSKKERYVLFFKNKDWYYYDVISQQTTNITASIAANFYQFDRLNKIANPIDTPWFSADYRYIYLTSQNDIWRYALEDKKLQRITQYDDKKISFRIKETLVGGGVQRMKWNYNPVLLHDYVLLHMLNNETELHEGVAIWKNNQLSVITPPVMQLIDQFQKSAKAVSYQIQNANSPPALMVYTFSDRLAKNVHKVASESLNHTFPRTEIREWTNYKGERTYVTVILPPTYSPEKKYPTIVRIYENEAKRFKHFEYPTYHNATGFNRTLMAQKGYIVVLPRITYEINKVGPSALKAVEETMQKVQSWYAVDPENIGLIGHSFGGYETNYILTKSALFKTAISGSSITDIIADYFTVHKMYKNSNISRYTDQQFRFSGDFFSLKKEYLENNPILFADNINTPVLLWSGKADEHVEWRQSVEMFMALTSLKKEVRLLLVPNEKHVLTDKRNQTIVTEHLLQWFNFYLKDSTKPAWF